jgi:hypothetical protein
MFAPIAAMLLSLMSMAIVGPASAAVDLVRVDFEYAFSDTGGGECLPPGTAGIVTGTVTASAQDVLNATGFHNHRTTTLEYDIDFADGSYVIGTAVEHATINVNFWNSQLVNTIAIHEPRTIYDSTGQPIGRVMIHYLLHIIYRDINQNFQPDPGEVTANIEDFRFTCH